MPRYSVRGNDRCIGSSNFDVFVIELEAEDMFEADKKARDKRASEGREHVTITKRERLY